MTAARGERYIRDTLASHESCRHALRNVARGSCVASLTIDLMGQLVRGFARMRTNISSFKYSAVASACVVLLLGSACARENTSASGTPAQRTERAQDAGERFDAGAASADAAARSGEPDAATDSKDAEAESSDERARAGSGGDSKSTRVREERGGAGGTGGVGAGGATSRATGGRSGTAGQPTRAGAGGMPAASESEAVGGAGGAGDEAAESGGAGGTRAEGEAGSESEGAAGEPAESEEEESESSTDAGAPSGSDEPSDCERIVTACAAVTDPSEDVTSCLSVGQAADASACQARIEDCRQSCGAPLCAQVLVGCPATGSGPVQGCHQIGVTDNAGDCFGDGVKCLEYCGMVMTP